MGGDGGPGGAIAGPGADLSAQPFGELPASGAMADGAEFRSALGEKERDVRTRSKDTSRPAMLFYADEWHAFVCGFADGEFTRPCTGRTGEGRPGRG
jgi:hypothetical protein